MSIPPANRRTKERAAAPLLVNGDHMKQPEFHRRYEQCPEDMKCELIGGIVYMASPLRRPHSTYHMKLSLVLALYEAATPGAEGGDNATTILGEESEPQPDLHLRILPECGGQSRTTEDEYIAGAPELVAEIAHNTLSIDLHRKRQDYERAGVREYLVLCVEERELRWFDFTTARSIRANRQGIYQSRVFPGLWVDGPALLARDANRLIEVVRQGTTSRPHAAFVKRLEAARRRHTS